MKRILSIVLTLYLCLLLIPTQVFAADTDSTTAVKVSVDSTAKNATSLSAPVVTVQNVTSTGKIKLSWNKVKGATKYEVYRATSKSGTYTRLITTTDTSVTNTSTNAGQRYYYKVRAVASKNVVSKFSSVVSRLCDLAQPKVSVTNVESSGKIKLSWKAVDGAIKYEVRRATSKSGTYKHLITTTNTSVVNTSAEAGKTYYYKVRAIHSDSSASSAYSSVVSRTCKLAQPKVEATNVESSGRIKLSWKKVSGAANYAVYRATSKDGDYKKLTTLTGTSFTDTSAKAGKAYYYKVRAIAKNTDIKSAYSSIDSRTCDLPRPKVTVKLTSSGNPKLSWKEVEGAVKYRIYRENYYGEFELIKTTTKTSFTDSDTSTGERYYYQVAAVHSNSKATSARCYVSATKTSIVGTRNTIAKGSSFYLGVVGESDGGKWSSSDSTIAKVSSTGKVTGKSKGSCSIYYTLADGSKLSYKVKVVNPVTLDVAYVSDTSILNECGITFHNNTDKTIEYVEFNIKQYDYKGNRVYGIYDWFYCDWYIDPLSDLTLEYWVDDMAKTCTTYIMEVKFTDGTYWYP